MDISHVLYLASQIGRKDNLPEEGLNFFFFFVFQLEWPLPAYLFGTIFWEGRETKADCFRKLTPIKLFPPSFLCVRRNHHWHQTLILISWLDCLDNNLPILYCKKETTYKKRLTRNQWLASVWSIFKIACWLSPTSFFVLFCAFFVIKYARILVKSQEIVDIRKKFWDFGLWSPNPMCHCPETIGSSSFFLFFPQAKVFGH